MGYYIGVDFGGTRTKIGIVDGESGIVKNSVIVDTTGRNEEEFMENFCMQLSGLLSSWRFGKEVILGIGVSIGSYIFSDGGIVDTMGGFINIPDGYPLKRELEKRLQMTCLVENDARLIGYAESLFGAGRGYGRVLTLTLGTGVGVGFTIDGKFPDPDAVTHLSGHIKVRSRGEIPCLDEKKCYCAVEGCLESTCSGTALESMAKDALGVDNKRLFDLAGQGEKRALDIVYRYLDYLIVGLNQYVYCFAPDIIILGGGVSGRLESYLDYIKKGMKARIHCNYSVDVAVAELKEDGGILGAAAMFWQTSGRKKL